MELSLNSICPVWCEDEFGSSSVRTCLNGVWRDSLPDKERERERLCLFVCVCVCVCVCVRARVRPHTHAFMEWYMTLDSYQENL
jgi:hypothetical protein